jgi:hypothetical protein
MDELKALELTIKKKWFDMIVSGEKKEEYRETKQYWITRLCKRIDENHLEIKRFSRVRFRNGYGKNAPVHVRNIESIFIGEGKSEWGAKDNENYFVIKLGGIA